MKMIEAAMKRLGGFLATFALVFGVASAQATCFAWFHQPKVPQSIYKFGKRKNGSH